MVEKNPAIKSILRSFLSVFLLVTGITRPAFAINGGVEGPSELAARTVFIVSTRGSYCTGTVLALDLIITAGHCVQPAANYSVNLQDGGSSRVIAISKVVLHPHFDPKQFETRKPSPDMAILKLAESLPARYQFAKISTDASLPKVGDVFVLAGFGFAVDGDETTLGKLRSVALPAIGTTGGIMVRLSSSSGSSVGACTGDSGGPIFREGVLAGVIGWINTPAGRNCGSVTGATLTGLQRNWIVSTVRSLGAQIRD